MSQLESGIIILLMVSLIVFFVYTKNTKKDPHIRKHNKSRKNTIIPKEHKDFFEIIKKSEKNKKNRENKEKCMVANSEFIEMQYHADYNDTITAINNLTPQKELFNLGFLPVKESIPNPDNIKELVRIFIDKLNREIKHNVSEYLHVNSGWSDMGKRRREKSGFEQQMEELGLPGSLYPEPASKSTVRLIKIDKAEQYNTENQIRFVIFLILQKENMNVKDQMVLKILFFLENETNTGANTDKFFDRDLSENYDEEQKVIIEQVFTVGYLTNDANSKTKSDKFHDYKGIRRNDGTIDQEQVIKIMLEKHKERQEELNSFMCNVDDDTKEIHDVPNIDNYTVYKNTRTIMDDLSHFPHRSFGDIDI